MKLYLLYFVNLSLVVLVSFGQNWNNWRGPNFNGSSDTTESLPEKFDNNTNVKWKYKLPGPSGGTPIINEQFVFISSIKILDKTSGSGELLAFCFNRESGELMWRNNAGSGYRPGEGDGFDYQLDSRSNYASPSPVTYGERVIFFFGNGDLVSYLMDGTE